MSAACKDCRKTAVCGGKPGGSAAYTLKETCVLKGKKYEKKKPSANTGKTAQTDRVTDKFVFHDYNKAIDHLSTEGSPT
jgi:hypothetical protein